MRANSKEPEAIEPAFVTDTFATGMLPIEDLGDFIRITFYADRAIYPGRAERVIVSRVVWSRASFMAAHQKVRALVDAEASGKVVPIR